MKVPDCHTYFNFICFHNYIIMQYANTGNGILKTKNTCTFSGTGVAGNGQTKRTRPAISDKPCLHAFRFTPPYAVFSVLLLPTWCGMAPGTAAASSKRPAAVSVPADRQWQAGGKWPQPDFQRLPPPPGKVFLPSPSAGNGRPTASIS